MSCHFLPRATVCARTDVENQALLSPTKRHILDFAGLGVGEFNPGSHGSPMTKRILALDTVISHGTIARRNLGGKGYGRYLGRAQPFAPLSTPPHR
jgi:hypothetical protein